MSKPPLRTTAQARQWLDEQGMSITSVARRFGCSQQLVDAILRGGKRCHRGTSHNVAVYLGLKHGVMTAEKQTRRTPASVQQGAAA